ARHGETTGHRVGTRVHEDLIVLLLLVVGQADVRAAVVLGIAHAALQLVTHARHQRIAIEVREVHRGRPAAVLGVTVDLLLQPGRTDERTVLQVARLTEQPAEAQVGTQRAGAGAARLDPHRLAEQDGALDVQIGAAAGDGALQVAAAAEADGAVQRGQHAAALDVAGADVAVVVAQGDGHAPVGVLAGAPVGAQAQADHVGVGARHGGAGVIVLVAVLHRGPAAHATHLAVEVEVAQGLVGEGADVVLVELHA